MKNKLIAAVICCAVTGGVISLAPFQAKADDQSELAKKLANPIASLISVPIQVNYDENIGPQEEGSKWVTNIQPVIPLN